MGLREIARANRTPADAKRQDSNIRVGALKLTISGVLCRRKYTKAERIRALVELLAREVQK